MTRALTVSEMKGANHPPVHAVPGEGTAIRAAYDALRRGETVTLSKQIRRDLQDYYGMEIKGNRGRGHAGCVLIGEWEGAYFVPLERIVQDDSEAA